MRNSFMLLTLGAMLAIGRLSALNAQPAGTNQTVQATEPGELAEPVWFEWKSGRGDWTLSRFLEQIKTNFGFDLRASADIPEQMLHVRVPSMKITTSRVWDVLLLYNQISNDYPEIGSWIMVRSPSDARFYANAPLNAIFLVPPKQTDQEDALSVRAFTLRDIPDLEQNQLFKLINLEGDRLKLETEKGIKASLLRGDVHFHKETGICVATGGKTYVEMVGSLIDAFREGRHLRTGVTKPYSPKPQAEK
jgi:hypothetical protein